MISLRGVTKSFDGGTAFAVRDVSFEVPAGAFVAIVGGSGSGKTTTLKTINRLIDADSGSIAIEGRPIQAIEPHALRRRIGSIEGRPIQAIEPHALRRRIGYVFQGIGLFPHMNVAANIGITPQLLGWRTEDIRARTIELLDLIDLPREFAMRMPSELSGGQRQRIGVARALAARPSIMLMDEPFGALDPLTRDALGASYRRLHDQMKLTTLMVTHDVLEAVLLADRILVMRAGEIVADGAPRELLNDHPDLEVRALMDMPRRQSTRVQSLLENGRTQR